MEKIGKVHTNFYFNNKVFAVRILCYVPRVGDEVRFSDGKFFTVKSLVWPMDEEDYIYERCNVELVEAPLDP